MAYISGHNRKGGTVMVTIFKSGTDAANPFYVTLGQIYTSIQNGKYQKQIEIIRATPDKIKRDALKLKLPTICFSGEFTHRANANIIKHSGFTVVDFDHIDDMDLFWLEVTNDEY